MLKTGQTISLRKALEKNRLSYFIAQEMAADLAGQNIVKASSSFERFRQRVLDSCSEVAARWDGIEPPDDYDGPNWH